jgi:hypothetical protein
MHSANLRAIVTGLLLTAAPLPALAFENFDQGKTPQQLFNSDCGICHRRPEGLGASMSPQALGSFIAQHYTASKDVAGMLTGYLISVSKERQPSDRPVHRRPRHAAPQRDAGQDAKPPRRAAKPHRSRSGERDSTGADAVSGERATGSSVVFAAGQAE